MAEEVKAGGEPTLDEIAAQVFAVVVGAAGDRAGSDDQLKALATRAYRAAETLIEFRRKRKSS